MKKKSLISLSSLLLASALLVGCGNKTTNQQTNVEDKTPTTENDNEVEKRTITIDLKGATLKEEAEDKTSIRTRSGTLWSVLKNLAPQKEDITTPDPTYIESISYSFDEAGEDLISDSDAIRVDTKLYLQIKHKDPETGITVKWLNDGGELLYGDEKYAVGETPFYKGEEPKSSQHPGWIFTGWLPAITPIEAGETDDRSYVAQYLSIGVDCTVTYDLNYEDKVETRIVKQHQHAAPLDPEPVRENYTFDGWYQEQECQNLFDFDNTEIVDNLTHIYAKWNPVHKIVTVDPNGGTFKDGSISTKNLTVDYNTTWKVFKEAHDNEIGIQDTPVGTTDNYKYQYYDPNTSAHWTDLTDDYVITTNLSIKVVYTSFTATLKFVDDYGTGATLPDDLPINYGTKWIDIKNECIPSVLSGYEFDHYYIDNGEGLDPTIIDDNYIFNLTETGTTITLHLSLNVTVNFETDVTKGVVPYSSAKLLTGTKWSSVKNTYEPHPLHPEAYPFDKYVTNDTTPVDVTDAYIFTKPVTLSATYSTNKVTLTFVDSYQSGATLPETAALTYGTKWGDIKDQYLPTNVPVGYEFAHYYINNGEETGPTVVDDDYVFTTDVTLNANWSVMVNFETDATKGVVPYASTKLLTGTKWSSVKDTYKPHELNPGAYPFNKYVINGTEPVDVTDDYIFTKPVTLTATYSTNKVTLTFVDDYESGATLPGVTQFTYGTRWADIKNQYSPTDVPLGYEFAHYYIDNGEGSDPTIINDNYAFTTDVTLKASWSVTVAFNSDKTIGVVPYASTKLLTGTEWSTIKTTYQPVVVDPTIHQFDKYVTNDATPVDVTDTYTFTKPVVLTAQYKGATANSFANDSWETFTSYISGKTFTQLSTEGAYKDEFDGNGGTFVGLTRTVDVQGKTYTVRVIDEASEGSSTLAHSHLFTFEFTNALDLEVPYSLNANDNCYKNSYIKNYLNNSFVNELPKALKDSIKETPVKYFDTTVVPVEERDIKTDNEKLFVLSASELNFATYPDYTGMPVKEEGSYAYYKKAGVDKKKTLLGKTEYVNYWTRSADASGITEAAWNVNSNGTLGYLEGDEYCSMAVNSGGVYVAPAFEL